MRQSEEEQLKKGLESAQAERHRLLRAQEALAERDRRGRGLVLDSAHSGELRDRLAGLEETRAAGRLKSALWIRIATAGQKIEQARRCFMAKRTERRQVETLIEQAESRQETLALRREQQEVDDGHRSRRASPIPKSH